MKQQCVLRDTLSGERGRQAIVSWSNPHGVDLKRPYLYLIVVRSPEREYRYVGKGSSPSRMDAYARNVQRIRAGKTKRPPVTRDGRIQSAGNLRYRYVHLMLAVAVERGWEIEHFPLENCERHDHTKLEKQRKLELKCEMNDGASWLIEDFARLASEIPWRESHK